MQLFFLRLLLAATPTPNPTQTLCPTATDCSLPEVSFDSTTLGHLVILLYQLIGAASLLFLIIGATKYVLSGGDPSGTRNAKETITYAIVGLVISFLAFAAVQFVTKSAGSL